MGCTYDVVMKTQLGDRRGKLYLERGQEEITGFLNILGHENPVRGNAAKNKQLVLDGEIVTLLSTLSFHAQGYADNETVRLTLYCPNHIFCITGSAIEGE